MVLGASRSSLVMFLLMFPSLVYPTSKDYEKDLMENQAVLKAIDLVHYI